MKSTIPANGVVASISVGEYHVEWEISWVVVLTFLLTVVVVYGHACFHFGQKNQMHKTPVKLSQGVPEELWIAQKSGTQFHVYKECGRLVGSNSKMFNTFCAQCANRSGLVSFKVT